MHCKQHCPHQVTNDPLPFLHTVRLTAARAEQPKHHGRDWQTSALCYDLTKTARNTAWHNRNTLFTTVWDLGFWLELVTTADTDYLLPTTYYHSYKYSHRPTYIYNHIQVYQQIGCALQSEPEKPKSPKSMKPMFSSVASSELQRSKRQNHSFREWLPSNYNRHNQKTVPSNYSRQNQEN